MTPLTAGKLRGAAASLLISAPLALAWGLSGSVALPGSWRGAALVVVVLLTFFLGMTAFGFVRSSRRFPEAPDAGQPNPFRTTSYRISVLTMLLAFPVAGRWLTASGHPNAIMPVVAIIVGLHFLGLVKPFRSTMFVWVAGAFCLVGGVGLLLPAMWGEAALRQAFVGLGCAGVLWFGVTPLLLETRRALSQSRESH